MGCPIRRAWMAGRHPGAYKDKLAGLPKFAQPQAAQRVSYKDVANDVFTASQEAGTP